MSITIRPYVPAQDRPSWLDIYNRANAEKEGFVPDTLELVERYENSPREKNRRRFVAQLGGCPVGIACADVDPEISEPKGDIEGPCVVPEARRHGVGTALLNTALADLRERGMKQAELTARDTPAANAFAARHGFKPVRSFTNLRRSLIDLPPLRPDVDVAVTELDDADLATYVRLWNEAFSEYYDYTPFTMENARFWRESLRRVGVVVQFAFARVAGEPVGFVFTAHQPHGVASLGVKRGGIWSIGVLKPWRGRGIASGLIIHGMHWLRRLGMDDIELWVDDMNVTRARGVYERLGFGPAYRSLAYRRDMAAP